MRIFVTILILSFSLVSFANIDFDKKEKSLLQTKLSEEKKFEFDFSFAEAVKFKILGDYKSAVVWFNNCLKIDPQSAAVRYELSNIYILSKDYNSALQLMRDAIRFNPHNIWYKILLANILQNKAMIDKACEVYDDILAEYPDRHEFLYFQVNLYVSVEKWKSALKVYERIEKTVGVNEAVSFEKYKLYLKSGNKTKAKKEINKLIKEYPEKTDYLGLLAELYIKADDESKAMKIFDKMLKLNPDNGFVHFYLSEYYRSKASFEKSQDYLLKALKSSNVNMNFKLQYVYKLFSQYSNSLSEMFTKSVINTLLTNYPDDPGVLTLYVDYLLGVNNFVEAKKNINKILKFDKYNYRLWNELLLIDNRLNDIDAMFNDASEAIKFFPDEPFPYLNKGLVYLSREDYKLAVQLFEKGISLTDDSNEKKGIKLLFYMYLGECYYNLDRIEEAFRLFDKALVIDPNNVGLLNNYSYYLALRNEELEKAEKMISRCIEIEGNEPTYLDTYAYILYKRGKYSMAKFFIKKAVEKDPKDAVYWEHYGDIVYKLGDKEEAMKLWKKALKLGGKGEFLEKKIESGKLFE